MKKSIAVLLAVLLLVGLAACGGGASSSTSSVASTASASVAPSESDAPDASEGTSPAGDADWAYIEDKGELIIGITYFEPMNYLLDDGTLTGFETEFAEAVCEILGVTPKFQEISWSAKETELAAKNIDCIWNGMTITPERIENMTISQPYMANRQVLIVKSENAAAMAESVAGMTIVAEAESAGEGVLQSEEFFADANTLGVDTQAKGLMEVAAGTADGCVVDYVVSIGMIGEGTDYADLVTVDEHTFAEEEYGIAIRKGETAFEAKLNDAIDQLREKGKLAEIAEKYKLEDLLIG